MQEEKKKRKSWRVAKKKKIKRKEKKKEGLRQDKCRWRYIHRRKKKVLRILGIIEKNYRKVYKNKE